ncbi:MAG TPA: hypothetical protein VM674_06215 [Candidatus Acidoferrum sp.]|nr:hypothetical protein [Candidatus Acidoferrum sp.]
MTWTPLQPPLLADVTRAAEHYMGIGEKAIEVKPGDMSIRDGDGIISTVLYGPHRRTQLGPGTRAVLFTTYAPGGISQSEVEQDLSEIESLVMTQSPAARTEWIGVRRA